MGWRQRALRTSMLPQTGSLPLTRIVVMLALGLWGGRNVTGCAGKFDGFPAIAWGPLPDGVYPVFLATGA